ncbi:MAG: hypothetical protein ABW003_16460 [Microvirga sp.]
MAQFHFNDEILMAFADGELDETVAASVEQAMAKDPAIAQRIAGFLRSRRMIRLAYPEEALPDVPPELKAAVLAQIERFEAPLQPQAPLEASVSRRASARGHWSIGFAMAAGVAALAFVAIGYMAGRQGASSQSPGPIAQLSDPEISRVLSESASGQEQALPFGRMRVISTFRVANGSLCREFRLQVSAGSSDAIACHADGWTVTFAVASAAAQEGYVPSDGSDLMASYLKSAGAGEPLLDAAEAQALNKARAGQ